MANTLAYYISCFSGMNCNKRCGETAPHKAVMLLAIIEEVQLGHIANGFIPLNDRMANAFKDAWRKYVGEYVAIARQPRPRYRACEATPQEKTSSLSCL